MEKIEALKYYFIAQADLHWLAELIWQPQLKLVPRRNIEKWIGQLQGGPQS